MEITACLYKKNAVLVMMSSLSLSVITDVREMQSNGH